MLLYAELYVEVMYAELYGGRLDMVLPLITIALVPVRELYGKVDCVVV